MSDLADLAIKLLVQGVSKEVEELEVRLPMIKAIEAEVGSKLPSLSKFTTPELIKLHERVCN